MSILTSGLEVLEHPGFAPSLIGSIKVGRMTRIILNFGSNEIPIKNLPQTTKDAMMIAAKGRFLVAYESQSIVRHYPFVTVGGEYLGFPGRDRDGRWLVCGRDMDREPEIHEAYFNRLIEEQRSRSLSFDELNGVLMGQPPPLTASLKS